MRIFHGLADLTSAVGTHLGYSDWRAITQQQVDQFAATTDDHQWIHTDPKRAAVGPFGATIAHGFLTLSLLTSLVGEVYRVDGLTMSINYGFDSVRFPAPVPVGSRVRAGVELRSLERGATGLRSVSRITVEIEGADKPACVADWIALLIP